MHVLEAVTSITISPAGQNLIISGELANVNFGGEM